MYMLRVDFSSLSEPFPAALVGNGAIASNGSLAGNGALAGKGGLVVKMA